MTKVSTVFNSPEILSLSNDISVFTNQTYALRVNSILFVLFFGIGTEYA